MPVQHVTVAIMTPHQVIVMFFVVVVCVVFVVVAVVVAFAFADAT